MSISTALRATKIATKLRSTLAGAIDYRSISFAKHPSVLDLTKQGFRLKEVQGVTNQANMVRLTLANSDGGTRSIRVSLKPPKTQADLPKFKAFFQDNPILTSGATPTQITAQGALVPKSSIRKRTAATYLRSYDENPVLTVALGASAAYGTANILGSALYEAGDQALGTKFERLSNLEREGMRGVLGEAMRFERLERDGAANLERLAHLDPQLYQSIARGRRLPRDATVIGGRMRTDLLQEMGMLMATGRAAPPPTLEDQFMSQML